jgi:bifunctional non-homologous end joining protein LigD
MVASATPAESAGVGFHAPMLCLQVASLPEGPDWLYEIKWDGYRAIGAKSGRSAHLYSRNGRSFDRDFAQLLPDLARLRCRSAVVDGEVVAWDEGGKPSFQLLQKRSQSRRLNLVLFDLLFLNGRDLRDKPLTMRRAALQKIIPRGHSDTVVLSRELQGAGDQLLEQARKLNLEGIVAKKRDSRYECNERSGAWVKRRAGLSDTFLVGGYVPGSHGFDELILGARKGRALHFVARLRAGFVPATKAKIMAALKPHVQEACPFANLPESGKARWGQALDAEAMKKCRWVKPAAKVEVAFVEWTEGGKLRHPKFVALASR